MGGGLEISYLDVARELLDAPESSLHRYPMPKWFFGAYEAVDDAFALLQASRVRAGLLPEGPTLVGYGQSRARGSLAEQQQGRVVVGPSGLVVPRELLHGPPLGVRREAR